MNVVRTGRKPLGPQIAQRLEGSQAAKMRLEVILQTITGQLTIAEACEQLGIGESRFHALRLETLQATLDALEPRPLGRPSHSSDEAPEIEHLKAQLRQAQLDLEIAELKLELVRIHPNLITARKDDPKKNARHGCQHRKHRTR